MSMMSKTDNRTKTIAFYLPQFHRTPENDKWWGEGYTEWTAVKQAKPLFENHYQPHIPLNENYYNLLDKSTMMWQAELMRQYGVDGLCFYHYYFGNGKKVLEKPAENLILWKDINMPFCFCWANESWVRSWSNISGNSWDINHEGVENSNSSKYLIKQEYGSEKEWEEHYNYLQLFFEDKRYIKKEGRPLFIIYRPKDIDCLDDMFSVWNRLSSERGVKRPYYITIDCMSTSADAVIMKDPFLFSAGSASIDYEMICKKQMDMLNLTGENSFICCQMPYDTTARQGEYGRLCTNVKIESFYELLCEAYFKCNNNGSNLLFINAWNEWAEGMHLEPDIKYGFKWLKCIESAKEVSVSDWYKRKKNDQGFPIKPEYDMSGIIFSAWKKMDKYQNLFHILDQWMLLNEQKGCISKYISDKGYESVVIYGMGSVGRHLLFQLQQEKIEKIYCVDKSVRSGIELPIYHNIDSIPEIDIVVICVAGDYQNLYHELKKLNKCEIISIREMIEYAIEP